MFSLLNFKLIGLSALAGVALSVYPAIKLHNWRVDSLRAQWEQTRLEAIKTATDATQKVCDDNNQITKEAGDALQKRLNAVNARYYSVLKNATASDSGAATIAAAAARIDAAPSGIMPFVHVPTLDGIHAAKIADDTAAKLISLQDTVAAIYELNGQADKLPAEYRLNDKYQH